MGTYDPDELHTMLRQRNHFFGKSPVTQEAHLAISPFKKITLRSECIQPVAPEKGAVSAEDYTDMQQTILKEILIVAVNRL